MHTPDGKEVMAGIIFGAVGIIAVRIFCFLVCLATGYPADIWNIFGQEKWSGLNICSFFLRKMLRKRQRFAGQNRARLRKNTSDYGKTKTLKCVLRRGKTIAPSRTSAEKTMPLNRVWWAYTDKSTQSVVFCYQPSRKRQRNI